MDGARRVNAPLQPAVRDKILAGLPEAKTIVRRTLKFFKGVLDQFKEEIENFGNAPSMYAGLVDTAGKVQLYDGGIRFKDAEARSSRTTFLPAIIKNISGRPHFRFYT